MKLPQSSLVKNTMKLASSNVLMYLIPVIVTPILTRIYEPASFGEWGVFSGLFSIINVVLFLCLENAIVKSKDQDYVKVSIVSFITAMVIIAIVGVLFLIGDFFEIRFVLEFPCKTFFVVYLLANVFYTILFNIANRKEQYWVMSVGSLSTGIAQAIIRILFGYIIIFDNGLIAGTVFAQIIATIFFVAFCGKWIKRDFRRDDLKLSNLKKTLISNKKFPLYDAPATLLAFSAFNLPVIILSLYFDKSEIGCYSVILQLLLLPMSFIGSAIGKVYYQEISKACTETNIAVVTKKILKFTSVIAILPMLFLVVGGDKLVAMFLGSDWATAGDVAICLSLWSFPTILTQPIVPLYRCLNKQNNMMFFNALYFIIGIGVLTVLCYYGCNMYVSLFVYAIMCSLIKLAMFGNLLTLSKLNVFSAINKYTLMVYIITVAILIIRVIPIVL